MMRAETLQQRLCKTFCAEIEVHSVPAGLAVSSPFEDKSGDPIGFYVISTGNNEFLIEDNGAYLSNLSARNVAFDQGSRKQLLDSILEESSSYWDPDSLEIRSGPHPESDVGNLCIKFLSSLIRVRDIELLSRDFIRSTFREDALAALTFRFSQVANFDENAAVSKDLADFPADLLIKPNQSESLVGAIYFVNNNERLGEALMLQMEAQRIQKAGIEVIAIVEELAGVSTKKFQRAQNRSLTMPIFRGDEDAAVTMVGRKLGLSISAS